MFLSSNVNIIPIKSKNGKTDPVKLMEAAYEEENNAPALYSTEAFKLGEVILPFVKDVLE